MKKPAIQNKSAYGGGSQPSSSNKPRLGLGQASSHKQATTSAHKVENKAKKVEAKNRLKGTSEKSEQAILGKLDEHLGNAWKTLQNDPARLAAAEELLAFNEEYIKKGGFPAELKAHHKNLMEGIKQEILKDLEAARNNQADANDVAIAASMADAIVKMGQKDDQKRAKQLSSLRGK